MNRALLLKLHRWITLVFAAPLLVVIVTGVILSIQPVLQQSAIMPGALTQQGSQAATFIPKFRDRKILGRLPVETYRQIQL